MIRIETISLAGRAHYAEPAAAERIETWLNSARASLAADPDVDELIADFEQAISDKCVARTPSGSDVITKDTAAEVLASLGEVEPANTIDHTGDDAGIKPTTVESSLRDRKLYRLPDDGIIAGVCAGIAAWSRIDVTVIRAAVVVLTILTSGALAVAYIALALILPDASTPDQRAAAYGLSETATARIAQAREGISPALSSAGKAISRVMRLVLRAFQVALIIAVTALLSAWLLAAIWMFATSSDVLQLFESGTGIWFVIFGATCIAWILIAPLLALLALTKSFLADPSERSRSHKSRTPLIVAMSASWIAAFGGALLLADRAPDVRGVMNDDVGRITYADTTYCFTGPLHETDHCEPGDEQVR